MGASRAVAGRAGAVAQGAEEEEALVIEGEWVRAIMSNTTAAFWSAIAASFSALASLLILWVQRQSPLESVRPEIVLTGWTRRPAGQSDGLHEEIVFQTIRNVGRGAALHVMLHTPHEESNRPTAVLSTKRLPILAADEAIDLNGEIDVWWKNVEPKDGIKLLGISIVGYCRDTRGLRHETRYDLFAVELGQNVAIGDDLAPGLSFSQRTTKRRSRWRLRLAARVGRISGVRRRLSARVRRIPLVRRLFRADRSDYPSSS